MPSKGKRIGYFLSEKKRKKLNFQNFTDLCRKRGLEVVKIELNAPLVDQGPFDVIIHKISDLMLESDYDIQSFHIVQHFQEYMAAHPNTVLLDPLPAMKKLLDRFQSYKLIHSLQALCPGDSICSLPYVEINSSDYEELQKCLRESYLTFPIICKTRVAHGESSHKMALIFNEEGLRDITPPCVLQSFINHSAVLYKIFVVGESHFVVKRPSLKNFPAGKSERRTIFFNSHEVSKPESSSHLTEVSAFEGVMEQPTADVIKTIVNELRTLLGMSLFGVDIIISNQTGQHAVIDINAFPGYEGVPEFFSALVDHIEILLEKQKQNIYVEASPVENIQCMKHPSLHQKVLSSKDLGSLPVSKELWLPETCPVGNMKFQQPDNNFYFGLEVASVVSFQLS
ncbi:inositol-tetrakisphosphate 1-kinase-like [Protopterus annectens]|uniref:inositol-tetrakisphosphate 1-kinase-like n=1 Tax=Protopterus annectens TaxID=7888 RepID=UPI001CF9B87D|nr:inositol-tetrakisphosphate 1-kinase-like [Protopterus annectens]